MKKRSILASIIVIVIAFTLTMTGCAQAPASESQAPASTDKPTDVVTDAPASTEQKVYKIGVTLPMLSVVHWANQKYGYELAGQELGCEVTVVDAGGYEFVEKQINQIQDFIASGMDAIIVAACDQDAVVNVINEAVDAGIVVINVNNMSTSDKVYSKIRSDDNDMGVQQARLLAEGIEKVLGKTEAKVVMVNAAAGSALTKRGDGFRAEIEANYPGIEILDEQFVSADPAKASAVFEDFLQTYPEIDGVFCWSDTVAVPIAHLANASGREIVITAMDVVNPDTRTAIRNGLIYGTVAQEPITLGKLGVETAVKILNGEPYEKEIWSKITVVTTENLEAIDMSGIITPDQTR